jgi:hypothetical protein
VCGVTSSWNPVDDPDKEHAIIENVIPVAGNFEATTGGNLAPNVTRLKAHNESLDGLYIEFHGGKYGDHKQKAVITLTCDKERTGNERRSCIEKRADDEDEDDDTADGGDDKQDQKCMSDLQFVSYGQLGDQKLDVLELNWRTKYACEDYADSDDPDDDKDDGRSGKKSGWGFFTWFILMYVFTTFMIACTDLRAAPSSELQRTSSSAPGSTTTGTVLEVGTCFLTATRSAIFPTSSRTGLEKWSTRYQEVDREAVTALYSRTSSCLTRLLTLSPRTPRTNPNGDQMENNPTQHVSNVSMA